MDKDRRNGKGRGCSSGGRLYSIPCRASYFSKDVFEEYDEFIFIFEIILMQFILWFKSSSAEQLVRQTEATTFAFSSVFNLLLCDRRSENVGTFLEGFDGFQDGRQYADLNKTQSMSGTTKNPM